MSSKELLHQFKLVTECGLGEFRQGDVGGVRRFIYGFLACFGTSCGVVVIENGHRAEGFDRV